MIKLAKRPASPPRRRCPVGEATGPGLEAYLVAIRKFPLLSRADEQRLFQALHHGHLDARAAAREAVVSGNLRLVVKVAFAYRDCGIPVADLVSEGNLGLLKAVDRFDHERGLRFATYAIWWIRQEIRRALDHLSGPVRLPTHLRERIRHYRSLRGQLGRTPDDAETMRRCRINRRAVAELRRVDQFQEVSMHAPIRADDPRELGEMLPDSSLSPERMTIEAETQRLVGRLLRGLDERSRTVLGLRYGINSAPVSLERIAVMVGLSRERVRQIQQESLARLQAQVGIGLGETGQRRAAA